MNRYSHLSDATFAPSESVVAHNKNAGSRKGRACRGDKPAKRLGMRSRIDHFGIAGHYLRTGAVERSEPCGTVVVRIRKRKKSCVRTHVLGLRGKSRRERLEQATIFRPFLSVNLACSVAFCLIRCRCPSPAPGIFRVSRVIADYRRRRLSLSGHPDGDRWR